MLCTISKVKDEARSWSGDHGEMHSVEGSFSDGSDWSCNCKPENSAERIAEFKSLIGQEGEYALKARKEYKGRKQWTLMSWPGKDTGQAKYPGSQAPESSPEASPASPPPMRPGYQVRFRDTEEGFLREQWSIHRSVALQHAVAARDTVVDCDGLLQMAERFYQWLSTPPATPAGQPNFEFQKPAPTHPSLDELKDRFGMKSGAEIQPPLRPAVQTKLTIYKGLIDEAVQKKQLALVVKGGQIRQLIRESLEAQSLTLEEAGDLDEYLKQAEQAIGQKP